MAKIGFDKNKLIKAAEEIAEKELRRRVESLRCSVHGQRATLRRTGRTHDGPTYDIGACCEPLLERARKVLAGR